MKQRCWSLIASLLLLTGVANAAPVAVATYDFSGDSLAAAESGAPALMAINPAGTNAFITDTVFGTLKTVYRFDGTSASGNQGGLSLKTESLLLLGKAYSVDIVFSFDSNGPTWERILDASNRTSDDGFYVEPVADKLQIYPVADGPTTFTFGEYRRISLTNDGMGHVTAYLDGIFQFDLITDVMDFDTYANPDEILTFFSDNTSGPAQEEWVSGKVSLIKFYNIELTPAEVSGVPEPTSLALVGLGLLVLVSAPRRRPL